MPFKLKDIADLSGLSLATVSRVMSGKPGVNKETREKVINIAKSLDYKVNYNARSMKTSRTNTIGLVVADITNPFYSDVAKTIEIQARKLNYTVIVANTNNSGKQEQLIVDTFENRRVDGFIFACSAMDDKCVKDVLNQGTPAILYHRHLKEGIKHNFIGCDESEGVHIAVKHLADLGHRRVAFISGSKEFSTGLERLKYFIRERDLFGMSSDPNLIKEGGYNSEKTKTAVKELLSMSERPTAIFASSDFMAMEVLNDVVEFGLDVPRDISIIGFDNIPITAHKRINLTTVDIQTTRGAEEAVLNLINMIEGIKPGLETIDVRLETKLVVRGSTSVPCIQ